MDNLFAGREEMRNVIMAYLERYAQDNHAFALRVKGFLLKNGLIDETRAEKLTELSQEIIDADILRSLVSYTLSEFYIGLIDRDQCENSILNHTLTALTARDGYEGEVGDYVRDNMLNIQEYLGLLMPEHILLREWMLEHVSRAIEVANKNEVHTPDVFRNEELFKEWTRSKMSPEELREYYMEKIGGALPEDFADFVETLSEEQVNRFYG